MRPHATMPRWVVVTLEGEAGDAGRLEVREVRENALVHACLEEALAQVRFSPALPPGRCSIAVDRPEADERVRALTPLAGAPPWRAAETPAPSPCPVDVPGCVPLSFERLYANSLYLPDVRDERGPAPIFSRMRATLEFCVGEDGRTNRIRLRPSGAGTPSGGESDVVEKPSKPFQIAAERVSKWRFRPHVVAGKPTLACGRVDLVL